MADNNENCEQPLTESSSCDNQRPLIREKTYLTSTVIIESLSPGSDEIIPEINQQQQQQQQQQIKRYSCYDNLNIFSSHDILQIKQIPVADQEEVDEKPSEISTNSSSSSVKSTGKDLTFQQWLLKKDQERLRKLKEEKLKLEELEKEEQEKQEKLKLEQEICQKRLRDKQIKEIRMKEATKLKKLQQSELERIEFEKRQLENQLSYNLWCKEKQKLAIEKKIREQNKLIATLEEKTQKTIENQRVFNEWLKNAKNKPKPTPLNQGLKSFSTKVSFINPNPWNPPV